MIGLASDFDGTLLFNNKFKDSDLTSIKQFQKEGHLFGCCSGRPLIGIVEPCFGFIDLDFYIVSSGALILNKEKEIIHSQTIPYEYISILKEKYGKEFIILIQADYKIYSLKPIDEGQIILIDDESVLKDKPIHGISVVTVTEDESTAIALDINKNYQDIEGFQNKNSVDIVSKGCSKGKAVKIVKEYYGIDVMGGIGDSYNDMPMLEDADIGFTFHDSPDVVKDLSHHIVDSVSEAIDLLVSNT